MINPSYCYFSKVYFESLQDVSGTPKQIKFVRPTGKAPLKNFLPIDLLKHSFSFLSLEDLSNIPIVSKLFYISSLQSNVIDDFSPLIEKKKLYWVELWKFASLSSFFDKIIKTKFHCKEATIIENNPQLATENCVMLNMPHPKIRYGKFQFTICNSIDVKVERSGESSCRYLQGEIGKILCSLAAENDHLFTMRRDATIIQWNYRTGQIIKRFSTSLTGRIFRSNFLDEFSIRHGMLAVEYDWKLRRIDYISSETTKCIPMVGDAIPVRARDFVFRDKLFIADLDTISVLQITPTKVLYNVITPTNFGQYSFEKIAVSKDYICFSEMVTHKIHLLAHGNPFPRKSYNFKEVDVLHLIDNLLYGFNTEENAMYILNLNSGYIVSTINDIFHNSDISLTALETIVDVTRKERYKPEPSTCSLM